MADAELVYWLGTEIVIPKILSEDNSIVIVQSIVGDIGTLQLIITTGYNI